MFKVWAQYETLVTQAGPESRGVSASVAGGLSTDHMRQVTGRSSNRMGCN